jgi:hypothetical protein
MVDETQDQSVLGSASAGVGVATPPPQSTGTAAPTDAAGQDFGNALNGLFSAAKPPTTEAPPPKPSLPVIPEVPIPAPGAYNPEREQMALRVAENISDPQSRMRVQQFLKREYANQAMMDGVTQRARADGVQKAVSDYTTAVRQTMADQRVPYEQKLLIAKKLLDVMWQDPRTDYGETRNNLQAHMLAGAGIQDTRGFGNFYTEAFDAIANKQITDPRQILQMEAQQKLTYAGGEHLIQALNQMGKPDHEVVIHQQALALNAIKQEVLKDTDENIVGMKPSDKQYRKLFDVQSAFLSEIAAAGTDHDKIMKISSPEAVRALVDRVYPWYQRNEDYVTRGGPVNVNGVNIPPTVPDDPKIQSAYQSIAKLPPTVTGKDGKAMQISVPVWQRAIEIIRKNPSPENLAQFQAHTGQDPQRIIKALPYVAPPPGYTPPVVAATPEPAGFFSTLFRLGVPVPTEPAAAPAGTPAVEKPPATFLGANPPHEYLQNLGNQFIKSVVGEVPHVNAKRPDEYVRDLFGLGKKVPEEAKK